MDLVTRRNSSISVVPGLMTEGIMTFDVSNQKHTHKKKWYLLDPDSAKVQKWEAFIMLLLIYTAFATPFEVFSLCVFIFYFFIFFFAD
jgi:hypothetical protein